MSKPTTISISAKCSDLFSMTVNGENREHMGSYNGYVPNWFGEPKHYGDYVRLTIDIKTGQIIGWKVPTEDQITEISS